MITIPQYQKAQEKLKTTFANQEATNTEATKACRNNNIKYRDLIYELEKEQADKERAIKDEQKQVIDKIRKDQEPFVMIRDEFKKIVEYFLIIRKNNTTFKKPIVKDYIRGSKIVYEPFEVIIDDEYKTISAYIINNNKPVNKYTLAIIGNTVFNGEVMELKYDHSIPGTSNNANIAILIKSASSKENLIEWYLKKCSKQITEMLNKFNIAQREYKEAKRLYKEKEWQIAFLKHRKFYYEHHYSHGTDTDEYKEIIDQLTILKEA